MLPRVAPVAVCVPVVLVGVLLPCCCPSVGYSSFLFLIGAGVRLEPHKRPLSVVGLAWSGPAPGLYLSSTSATHVYCLDLIGRVAGFGESHSRNNS